MAPMRALVRAGTLVISDSVIVTPASRSCWVRDAKVSGRTNALTMTFLLLRLRAMREPNWPAAPATTRKL